MTGGEKEHIYGQRTPQDELRRKFTAWKRVQDLASKHEDTAREQLEQAEARRGIDNDEEPPSFEERYKAFYRGEFTEPTEEGTETTYVEYQFAIKRTAHDMVWLADFCLSAGAAGYTRSRTPDIFPGYAKVDPADEPPYDVFCFYFEKPQHQPQAQPRPAEGRQNPQK